MRRILGLLLLCLFLVPDGHPFALSSQGSGTVNGFNLPPTTKATRSYPRLVNYCHRMDLSDNKIPNRETYLAQWDVIILYPQEVRNQNVSLAKIRQVNPGIKIFAWIPYGQSSEDFSMSKGLANLSDFYVRDKKGKYLVPSWGGHIMNPYKNNYGWAKYVITYVKTNYLDTHLYDGVMFDCVWAYAPKWYSSDGADINEDSQINGLDDQCCQEGNAYLLKTLKAQSPHAIVTGNGGIPWPSSYINPNDDFYRYADGLMTENAFGDEFGPANAQWKNQWDYYTTALNRLVSKNKYYLMIADLRYGRSQSQAETATRLSNEDQRRFRLALTTTLMGDGYFGFDRGDCLHGQLWWFKEYDIDLGNPASAYETDRYAPGTYSREFPHGSVIVNPSWRSRTVFFTENRTDVSTGVTAQTFKLPANDGRIYMKVQ